MGNDMALLKRVYLATERIAEKWSMPLQNRALTMQQLSIIFEGRTRRKKTLTQFTLHSRKILFLSSFFLA